MKICVVGLGYIGLPTAAMFATHGQQVVGVDKNPKVLEALSRGEIIIEEKDLDKLVKQAVTDGSLCGSEVPVEADAFIIAVPTPITAAKTAKMDYVKAATESILPVLRKGNVVILESTSPVGTVEELMLPILERSGLKAGVDFALGHSPERVIPGSILYELVHNSRIAGGLTPACAEKIAAVYKCFVEGEILLSDARTAEMAKLTENTFRDVNIAFANEMAQICENLGINAWELIRLCNMHPRVNILQPGPGVGGHCIAVDPWFIVEKQPETAKLIHTSRLINDARPTQVATKVLNYLEHVSDPQVTVLGVTYKPDVDDLRESPVLEIVTLLTAAGVSVRVYDPFVSDKFGGDLMKAVTGSDLLILGVHHSQFKQLPLDEIGAVMRSKQIYDTRRFIDEEAAQAAGFTYYLLGRD